MKVKIIIDKSHMDMTFEKDDDELVDVTLKWIDKKLRNRLKEMKEESK